MQVKWCPGRGILAEATTPHDRAGNLLNQGQKATSTERVVVDQSAPRKLSILEYHQLPSASMPSGLPRVFWSPKADRNIESDPWGKEDLVQRIKKINGTDNFAFCIIENITKDWIDYLESDHGLHLDPNFCLNHASNQFRISKVHTWLWAGASFHKTASQKLEEKQEWRNIEGAYLLRDKEVWTRLSYCRIAERICR